MAEKKYLDLTGIQYYDGKIKAFIAAADTQVLKDAKAYADGLAVNYDAAGTAASKMQELANGQVKTNTEAIAKLNGGATTEGSVAKAIADAKAVIDGDIDAVEAKADKAQGEVDALETYVGTFTHATAKSVVEYVDAKTAGIATDAALGELQGKVTEAEKAIDAIEADYLKAADKTALQEQITANAEAIDAIEEDYLKAADKTELQGKIDLKADKSALEAEVTRATGVEESLQNQINTIMNNPDAEGAINSINEFTAYVAEHGEIAEGFRTDIDANEKAIGEEVTRAKGAEEALDGRIDALEAIDHEAYKAADTTLSETLMGEINKKADSGVVSAMDEAYKAADAGLSGRIETLEKAGYATVGQVATAKQEAIDAAAGDATTKAGQALTDAKAYTDTEVGKVSAVANKNKDDISALSGRVTTAEGEIDALQAAIGEGGSVTVAIAEAKKAGTDAQGEVDALEGVVNTLSGKVTANEGSISSHGDRLTALENKVGDGFVAIANSDIDALFA